jgi:hypothetical protein
MYEQKEHEQAMQQQVMRLVKSQKVRCKPPLSCFVGPPASFSPFIMV